MNESDLRSDVYYLGSSENKKLFSHISDVVHITAKITFIHVFIRSSNI